MSNAEGLTDSESRSQKLEDQVREVLLHVFSLGGREQ
jgi:hypothetical protein